MASHRAELGALRTARERIEAVLARSGNTPAALASATGALDSIAHLEGLITSGSAGPVEMVALAQAITAAQSTATALEAATSADTAHAAEQIDAASAEARRTVRSVMAGMRDFDDQLRFASPDDRRDYREREADRRAYIVQQPDTPAGNLNATGAAVGQMADAHAHGAGGPEFDQRWKALVDSTQRLREAAKANGVSTEEFDQRLRADLRRILKSKGLSDAEIDARFVANPDPLEAAKAFVTGEDDLAKLKHSAERADAMSRPISVAVQDEVKNVIASLQTHGVVAEPHDPAAQPDHGVAAPPSGATSRSL